MDNFSIEITRETVAMESTLHVHEERPVIAKYSTDSALDFASYIGSAIDYFKAEVKFNRETIYVSMLVRTYRDTHTIHISTKDGEVVATTN